MKLAHVFHGEKKVAVSKLGDSRMGLSERFDGSERILHGRHEELRAGGIR